MKARILASVLSTMLDRVAPSAPRDRPYVELAVTGDSLTVFAGNYEQWVSTTETIAEPTPGTVAVPIKPLHAIAKGIDDGAVWLTSDNDLLKVETDRARLEVAHAIEGPRRPAQADMVELDPISSDRLAVALKRAAMCADAGVEAYAGVHFTATDDGHLRMLSTDSYRAAIIDLPDIAFDHDPIMVPDRAISQLARLVDPDDKVAVSVGPAAVAFATDDVTLWSSLLANEKTPNIGYLLGQRKLATSNVQVRPEDVLAAVKLTTASTTPQNIRMRMHVDHSEDPQITAVAEDGSAAASARFTADYELCEDDYGTPDNPKTDTLELALNPRYATEILGSLKGHPVNIGIQSPTHAVFYTIPDDPTVVMIQMPVRIT